MAMDNMTIRKAQLEKLDDFIHTLYQETQTFKGYGIDMSDLEALYLHIHDLIQDLLSVNTTDEFMEKVAEFHKGIAGVLIIVGAGDPTQIAEELKNAHEGLSDMDVAEFLKNMKVKEKSTPKDDSTGSNQKAPESKPEPQVEEEEIDEEEEEKRRQKESDELIDQLDLKQHVKEQRTGLDDIYDKWNNK